MHGVSCVLQRHENQGTSFRSHLLKYLSCFFVDVDEKKNNLYFQGIVAVLYSTLSKYKKMSLWAYITYQTIKIEGVPIKKLLLKAS